LDTRRLQSFVKIVDTGSVTRAADLLHIAQPALSQQLAALEAQFKQKLLIRSPQGVVPTKAGQTLYRHAHAILKQLDQAHLDVARSADSLTGRVTVGLAPYSVASTLSMSLLSAVRQRHPGILLHINESFSGPYSELIMTGRMDMAVIHGAGPIKGVQFAPLLVEEFFLVAPVGQPLPGKASDPVALEDIAELPLLLPSQVNFVRKAVDSAFAQTKRAPRLVAEVEALDTLRDAVAAEIGCAILPESVASRMVLPGRSRLRPIKTPVIEDTVSLCVSDHLALSEPAAAVHAVLADLAGRLAASGTIKRSLTSGEVPAGA